MEKRKKDSGKCPQRSAEGRVFWALKGVYPPPSRRPEEAVVAREGPAREWRGPGGDRRDHTELEGGLQPVPPGVEGTSWDRRVACRDPVLGKEPAGGGRNQTDKRPY